MARHRSRESLTLIEALMRLGTALGYYADDEVRVTASGGAVDVAWFRGATARVPLFIFEVETTASSSAANNPLKVFAQKTDVLPKPLFYFHVFLTQSEQTERTELLEEQYGRFNYRVYRGGGIDPTAIVRDVLNQHRRVATDLDIRSLVAALRQPGWANVDLDAVLEAVESEDFRACYVPDYARLSYDDTRFRPHLVRQLTARQPYPAPLADDECWYATFIGSLYAPFLHAGIAARESTSDEPTMLSRLRRWQEGSTDSTMLQIGPYLGLSQDYDYFVLGAAAPFLALTEALFRGDEARRYCSAQLRNLIAGFDRVEPAVSLFSAVWLLWAAAAADSPDDFEAAQAFISERGGIHPSLLASPPSMLHLDRDGSSGEDEDRWWELVGVGAAAPPPLDRFRSSILALAATADRVDVTAIALDVLLNDIALFEWGPPIRAALAQASD